MADFTKERVSDALEVAIGAATHLTARDAAAVAAARALAAKIDAWDVIVQWSLEDARDLKTKPLPANDNTSLGTFLKYMEALQLMPPPLEKSKPGPASTASDAQQQINAMRQGLKVVS